jgi:hypothetical protein
MVADAQYSFYCAYRLAQGVPQEAVYELPLRNCHLFGTSTANIKIESFWRTLIKSQT